MNNYSKLIDALKKSDIERIEKYNKKGLANAFLDILEYEMSDFSYFKDIDYLNELLNILPDYIEVNNSKERSYQKLKLIHQKMKTYLVQKPGNIEKTNHNYKLLKNWINKIELIQISILYDYIDKYEGSKYKLIDYIIFDLKNISVVSDAINRFPYLVNYFDRNDKNLIVSICDAYIKEVLNYTEENTIDNIIYFDEVINCVLNSDKFMFDVIDKQTILKKIRDSLENIENNKNRKIFYLNSLIEKINDKKIDNNNSYLEYKYNINYNFDEAIKSEVRKLVDEYSISKEREEIDDYILTFDGFDSKEIDDALSIKILDNSNYLLGVHIADPTDIIDKKSIIFDEASKRTTSIYLSDKTYSMFPEKISTDLVSLKQGSYRPAISYYFEFDKNGNIINQNFKKTIIKVKDNMTYDDFNKILNMKNNSRLKDTIDNLSKISIVLQKYYNKDPLYEQVNRSEKNITNTNIVGNSCGEKVVESSMIFTNHMVAKYFKENNLPFIFRNHTFDKDVIEKLDRLKKNIISENNDKAYLGYIEMVKNLYPKAVYELENKGHFGLGIDCYCHITSPLRRMADVIGLLCLNEFYFNDYDQDQIKNMKKLILKHSKLINDKRDLIEKFSKEYELLK